MGAEVGGERGMAYGQGGRSGHWSGSGGPAMCLASLDHAGLLFESEPEVHEGCEAKLLGVRGLALREIYPPDGGSALLEQARQASPGVWGDAWISAEELR